MTAAVSVAGAPAASRRDVTIALTIGVYELTAQTQQIQSFTYQGFEAFTAATVVYMAIALAVTTLMTVIERRVSIPGPATRG